MKTIPLTQGKVAIVDDRDYDWLNQFKWRAYKDYKMFYAMRSCSKGPPTIEAMHRKVLGLIYRDGKQVDHIDGDGLNNQRNNLRICNHAQNQQNQRIQVGGTSRYKGVSWGKRNKRWIVEIRKNGATSYVGSFKDEVKAAKAYDKRAKELYREFARLNFPKEVKRP